MKQFVSEIHDKLKPTLMSLNLETIKTTTAIKLTDVPTFSILKNIEVLLSREISFGKNQLNDKKKESFYSEMGILLSSGIDIRSALEIIAEEQKSDACKKLFQTIKTDIVKGSGLSDAIQTSGKFSAYEYYSLSIGEESGRLKDVLSDLATYFSKKIKQRRQLTSALTYPLLVILTAVGAVYFMLSFIVPMFMDVFKRFNGEMPPLTRTVISVSVFFKTYSWLVIIVIITIVLLLWSIRKTERFRYHSTTLALKIPLFGDIIRKIYITRYCQSMAFLMGAKTPMLRSLHLVKQMIGFYPYEKAVETMESDILHGMLLHQSMAKFALFDARIISLIRVAEEVNQLDIVFARLNDQYNDELEHRIGMLSNLLEPIMIIVVGLLVSIILISMYLPLFQLSSTVY
jgi:type IV pilus assembly protein PilC